MKIQFPAALLFLLFITAGIYSCSSEKPIAATGDLPEKGASLSKDDPRKRIATEKFIEANKMDMLGDKQQALNLYRECLKIDPANDAAYYNIAKILYGMKQYVDAVHYAQQAVKLNEQNPWYLDLYGTLLGGLSNFKEAEKVYAQMVKVDQDNPDAWFNWAFFSEQNKQYEQAISILDQFQERFGISEEIITQKVRLWLESGKKDKAALELQKLIDTYPDEPKYYSLLLDFYMNNGEEDKAFDVLTQLIQLDPNDAKAYIVMAGYYQRKGNDEKADEAFQKVFSSTSLDIDFSIPILMGYLPYFQDPKAANEVKKMQALKYAELLTQSHPGEAKSHAIYADFLYQDDQLEFAAEEYKKAIRLDNSKFLVWQQLFFIYDRQRNYDSLLAVTSEAIELFPDQGFAYYFNGYASMQLKNYSQATHSFSKAVEIGSGDKRFLSQAYAGLGDAYYNLNNSHASDSCYEFALVFDPSNVYVLNNYSYYLSLRGEKLDEARRMAEQANTLEPNNAAYEDTYGWILYRSGKFSESKEWIGKALQHGGDEDGTVLEHYGDVLFKLGDVEKAVEYWMKAKVKNVESETIDKKIAERKLYEQ